MLTCLVVDDVDDVSACYLFLDIAGPMAFTFFSIIFLRFLLVVSFHRLLLILLRFFIPGWTATSATRERRFLSRFLAPPSSSFWYQISLINNDSVIILFKSVESVESFHNLPLKTTIMNPQMMAKWHDDDGKRLNEMTPLNFNLVYRFRISDKHDRICIQIKVIDLSWRQIQMIPSKIA